MAMTHGILREQVEKETSPAKLFSVVNQILYNRGIRTNFITSFYAVLDPVNSSLKYSLAGHPPPLLRKASNQVSILPGRGIALGVIPDAQYEEFELAFEPGESLIAYTDGLTDANNPERESFNLMNLETAIETGPVSAKDLIKHLQRTLGDWVKKAPNFDDITLLVVGRK
jgi:sigma-B regulation protein RsbU (phosphoserine phosphatase)